MIKELLKKAIEQFNGEAGELPSDIFNELLNSGNDDIVRLLGHSKNFLTNANILMEK